MYLCSRVPLVSLVIWFWLAAPSFTAHAQQHFQEKSPFAVVPLAASVTSDNHAQLTWATEASANFASFVVERSEDGQSFVPVAKVAADKEGNTYQAYLVLDARPLTQLTHYRLRQVAADCHDAFSPVESVRPAAQPKSSSERAYQLTE